MAQGDEIIHQQTRLRIMATLHGVPEREGIEFTRLKSTLQATDGNLGSHIATLEGAGYIRVDKDFVGKKPRTRVALTKSGRKAFTQHVEFLRAIVDGLGAQKAAGRRS
jgi:DNA-binding MarR family transcriptional regulator